ncbi:unnamed protein product [Bemisia tabaci]|uniref:Acyl-CoA synthetase family member 4 n=2 Tax=Bemisia tabaci TaxID=7038 RepID=A0A9P0G0R0_BEMTA|nr:unnamed protein product [Bemisia tabaci]
MELFHRFKNISLEFPKRDALICFDGRRTTLWTYEDLLEASSIVGQFLEHCFDCDQTKTTKFIAIAFTDQDAIHIALSLGVLKNESAFVFIPQSEISASFSSNGCCNKLGVQYIFMELLEDLEDHSDCRFQVIHKFTIFCKNILLCKWNGEKCIVSDSQTVPFVYAMQTSGTMGSKKIVRVTQDCILPNIDDFKKLFSINEHDSVLLSAPLTFDPSIVDIFLAITTGANVIILGNSIKAHPGLLLDTLFPSQDLPNVLKGHQLSILQTTPSLFRRWTGPEIRGRILNDETKLRVLALGGEECISFNILQSFKSPKNKTEIFNLYGLTEMSCWASYSKISFDEIYDGAEDKIPLGIPLSSTYWKIDVDNEYSDSAGNKISELILGTQSRLCFVSDETSCPTERKTGDLVKVSQGHFYFYGRKDRFIKFYGIKVNLQEIEDKMSQCSSVAACYCIHEPESNILYVLFSSDCSGDQHEISKIRSHFHHTFGRFIPPFYRLILVDEIPVTNNGKFNEEEMRRKLVSNQSNQQNLEPSKRVLERFKDTWLSHGLETQGGFKDVGGSSLIAVELTSTLNHNLPRKTRFKLLNLLLSNGSFIQSLRLLKWLLWKHHRKKPPGKFKSYKYKYSSWFLQLQKHAFRKGNFHLRARILGDSQKFYLKVIYSRSTNKKTLFKRNCKIFRDRWKSLKASDVSSVIARGLHLNTNYLAQIKTPECANLNKLKISIIWKKDLLSCVDNSPSIFHSSRCSSHLVISSHHGLFATLDGFSGDQIASYNFCSDLVSSACVSSSPMSSESFSYIGCFDGRFCKINNLTGKIIWCFKSQSLIKSRALQVAQTVYFASYDLYLYCLGQETGNLKWKLFVGHKGIHSNLLLLKRLGCICVCTLSGHVHIVDICRRRIKWTHEMLTPIFSSPCYFEEQGLLLVASVKGCCVCFQADTGAKLWSFELNEPMYADIVNEPCNGVENVLLCATQEGTTVCYVITKDAPIQSWKIKFGCKYFASPFIFPLQYDKVTGHSLFATILVSTNGVLKLLSLDKGTELGEFALSGDVFSSPIVYHDMIFIGCRDNHVYCLKIGEH